MRNGHVALMLLDLNQFKEVNDTFGQAVGDQLLQRVAEILPSALRVGDTVARLGGDEFAILLPATDASSAVLIATTLKRLLSAPVQLAASTLRPDASVGISIYPEHGGDAAALLQHAEVAMYQAKLARRDSKLYQPDQDLRTPDHSALHLELRTALACNQLRLHYQPIIDVPTGAVVAVEALVRWQHSDRGLLYPDAFLHTIEGFGLQAELTRWVLSEAVQQARTWQERGLNLTVNVNLAASNLQDETLIAECATLLARPHGSSRLCLELTEGALPADLSHTRSALLRLAAAGADIAIDDYGTGYSSLSRLARLPVDELKIDRMFVRNMTTNSVDAAIVASTVGLAHSLGVPVVAEGVEDQATLQHLREMGCDMVQGYYFSRPLPAEELEGWIAHWQT